MLGGIRVLSVSLAIASFVCACGSGTTEEPQRRIRTERDQFGLLTCSEENEATTCFTHRTIIGVSMGASGAGQLGFQRPELFDTIGMLGIPLLDWTYMMRSIERGFLGGFCDRETILANVDRIADPTGPAFCGAAQPEVRMEPSGTILEPQQDYNHWYRWIDEGRGGSFGRNKLRESFQDISLAFGNAIVYNPESPYFPPGVPMDYRTRTDAERCAQPLVIKGLKHKEYNPTGEYDVVAFCDTSTNDGEFLQERPSERATEILLAVDYNANGIRDYAEPILVMMHERYEDVGTTPGDTYDWQLNPTGKAANWRWDEGEPFEDTGLDGVAGTGDYGEGNGQFDYNPNVLNYYAQNPRNLVENVVPEGHLSRMNLYADAGIRDFLQSAGGTNWFWGALESRVGSDVARDYTTFAELPGGSQEYDFLLVDYSPSAIGRHAYVRYGDPNASEREIQRGDGHHVGPADQVLQRFLTSLSFVQSRFLDPDRRAVEEVGNLTDLIQPHTFVSQSLGRERTYGVVLPPGYNRPENANKRYPVVYFLHGQGMESQSLLASAILFFGYMAGSTNETNMRKQESDWAKFILIFPDSTCDEDACSSGNFNANHKGIDGNGPKYMDSIFELMAIVESTYRVAEPVEVPKPLR
jgi:hypothetical protein